MRKYSHRLGSFLLIALLLVACNQAEELPTVAPSAAAPARPSPTEPPPIPPTRDLNQPTATPLPTTTVTMPTSQPQVVLQPTVNITSPAAGGDFVLGSQADTSGLVQLGTDHALMITLVSATGHLLAETEATVSAVNSWQATLAVPNSVSGPAQLRADVYDSAGEVVAGDAQAVNLALDIENNDRYLALFRPLNGETAVAGHNLFFDGRTQRPANSRVTISLWTEGCQLEVARQSFTLGGSGYWQGFLIVPGNVSGFACAVAHFGSVGEDAWREAQLIVDILPAAEDGAIGVLIGNPPPGSTLNAGQSVLLYGTAYNAPDSQVQVSILLENGRILTEGVATADAFGYWEVSLFIPEDAEGPAQINATIGSPDEEEYAQAQNLVTLQFGQ